MAESPALFTVEPETDYSGRVACLRLAGEIDLSTVSTFEEAVSSAVDRATDPLRIDLAGVTFMDSSGLNALIRARNATEDRGISLVISDASEQVRHLFEISGLTSAFAITP